VSALKLFSPHWRGVFHIPANFSAQTRYVAFSPIPAMGYNNVRQCFCFLLKLSRQAADPTIR
jgi:hypothetical protein